MLKCKYLNVVFPCDDIIMLVGYMTYHCWADAVSGMNGFIDPCNTPAWQPLIIQAKIPAGLCAEFYREHRAEGY